MNPFKAERTEFIRRYFPYPAALEKAIEASDPVCLNTHLSGEDPLDRMQRFDRPERLYKILDEYGFNQHFNWSYEYEPDSLLFDWCSLYWSRGIGLWVHFEWMTIECMTDALIDIDMDDDSWNFLFGRRKLILAHFMGGLLIEHFKEEDFSRLLIDRREKTRPPTTKLKDNAKEKPL